LNNCPKCKGAKVIPDSKILKVYVEKGMKNKQDIVFEKESE
jgi:DnaJ-class molecular chaperone